MVLLSPNRFVIMAIIHAIVVRNGKRVDHGKGGEIEAEVEAEVEVVVEVEIGKEQTTGGREVIVTAHHHAKIGIFGLEVIVTAHHRAKIGIFAEMVVQIMVADGTIFVEILDLINVIEITVLVDGAVGMEETGEDPTTPVHIR